MIAFEIPIHHSINDTKLPQHIFNAYAVRFYSLNKNLNSIGESQSWFDLFLWGHEEKKPADGSISAFLAWSRTTSSRCCCWDRRAYQCPASSVLVQGAVSTASDHKGGGECSGMKRRKLSGSNSSWGGGSSMEADFEGGGGWVGGGEQGADKNHRITQQNKVDRTWCELLRLIPVADARAEGGSARSPGYITRSGLRGGRSRR
jgi:hypothetical protein